MSKPAFDPNKPFDIVKDKPAFDPSKPFEAAPEMSQAEAATIKAGEGLTMGARPFIAGLAGAAGNFVGNLQEGKSLGESYEGAKESFSEARQGAREEQKAASEQYPKTALASEIAGGFLMPGGSISSLGKAVKLGVVGGLARGAGEAEDISELPGRAAEGAIGGAATYGITKGIGKGLEYAKNKFNEKANEGALRSIIYKVKDFKNAEGKGKIQELGKTMLDEDILKAGGTAEDIAKTAEEKLAKKGEEIGQIYKQVTDTVAEGADKIKLEKAGFNPQAMVPELEEKLTTIAKGQSGGQAAKESVLNDYIENISGLGKVGTKFKPGEEVGEAVTASLPIKDALAVKKNFDKQIDYSKQINESPIKKQMLYEVRDMINKKIQDQAEVAGQVKGVGGELVNKIKKLNKEYGNLSEINRLASDMDARNKANSFFGLRDAIMGGGGVAAGGAAGALLTGDVEGAAKGAAIGLGGAGLSKLARTYGPNLVIKGLQKASEASGGMEAIARKLQSNPAAIQNLVIKQINEIKKTKEK